MGFGPLFWGVGFFSFPVFGMLHWDPLGFPVARVYGLRGPVPTRTWNPEPRNSTTKTGA